MVTVRPPANAPHEPQAVADLPVFVCPFVVLVDSREQSPWAFQGLVIEKRLWAVETRRATMVTADYSIAGLEDRLLIERKSGPDLVGSVTVGNSRFRREHERMAAVVQAGGFAIVIIEDSLSRICEELDADSGRRVTSMSIRQAAVKWPRRFKIPWLFSGSRREAELDAFLLMLDFWNEQGGPANG